MTFKFDIKKLKFKRPADTGYPDPIFEYTHENGYVQTYIADEMLMTGPDWERVFTGVGEYNNFKDILKGGRNALYKAYSMLPSGYIDENGEPLIQMDFNDADIYIKTGKLPSTSKLQKNEGNRGTLMISETAVSDLLDEELEGITPTVKDRKVN